MAGEKPTEVVTSEGDDSRNVKDVPFHEIFPPVLRTIPPKWERAFRVRPTKAITAAALKS